MVVSDGEYRSSNNFAGRSLRASSRIFWVTFTNHCSDWLAMEVSVLIDHLVSLEVCWQIDVATTMLSW
jgi:hypothetical protein